MFDFSDSLTFRAILIMPIIICGVLINGLSSYIMYTHKSFANPFGRIQGLQAACDSSSCLLVLIWTVINLIFGEEAVKFRLINEKLGQYALGFFQCSVTATFLLASSRFIAITFPMLYRTRKMMYITHLSMAIVIILNILYTMLYFLPGCSFSADEAQLVYSFPKTLCGNLISFYIDYVACVTIHGISAVINLATYIALRSINKKPEDLTEMDSYTKKRKREIKFYLQTIIHLALIVSLQTVFHIVDYLEVEGFPLFLGSTFIWMFVNLLQGCVVFFLNPEVISRSRRILLRKVGISSSSSIVATTMIKF